MCPICESPHRAEVDAALRAGSGYKALARRFGLDVAAVRDHRRQCLTRPTSPPPSKVVRPLPLREPYSGPVGAHAPAREERDPRSAVDFDARVAWIVAAMSAGTFDAPREVPLLAAAWGLSTDHTRRIVRAAGAGYRASTPDLDTARAISAGRWADLYRRALATDDLRAAAVALRGHDVVSGAANGAKAPESPIAEHPEFIAAAEMYTTATLDSLDVANLSSLLPDVPYTLLARVAEAVHADLDRRLAAVVASGEVPRPDPRGGVSLESVLAAQDAIRANTSPPYARARDGWT